MTKQNGKVAELRDKGYKVRIIHVRKYFTENGDTILSNIDIFDKTSLSPKGGMTIVEVTTPSLETKKVHTTCSDNDAYNKKIGVAIALGRALKALNK